MKIFKGKYYKELYELEKEDNKWFETQLNIKKDKIKELQRKNDDLNTFYKEQIEKLEQEVTKREELRRKVAGKVGGLTTEKNKLLNEKKEMLDMINKLLEEIRRKDRYKPSLKELKEYFKIKY